MPNFGALGMVLRIGMVATCLPKARDGHHMSALTGPTPNRPRLGDPTWIWALLAKTQADST